MHMSRPYFSLQRAPYPLPLMSRPIPLLPRLFPLTHVQLHTFSATSSFPLPHSTHSLTLLSSTILPLSCPTTPPSLSHVHPLSHIHSLSLSPSPTTPSLPLPHPATHLISLHRPAPPSLPLHLLGAVADIKLVEQETRSYKDRHINIYFSIITLPHSPGIFKHKLSNSLHWLEGFSHFLEEGLLG